jgi:hypothetical protein
MMRGKREKVEAEGAIVEDWKRAGGKDSSKR